MKKLKILHIIKKSSYDGASIFPIRLINHFEEYHNELLSTLKGSAHDEIIGMNINYHSLLNDEKDSLKNRLLKFPLFAYFLIKNNFDIIHYHLGGVGILFLATIFRKKAIVIHHIHAGNIVGNVNSDKLSFIQKSLLRFLDNRNIQIAVSENVKEFYQNEIGRADNLKVVKNFSPFEFEKKDTLLNKGVGYLGRIVREKRFDVFLSTIEQLDEENRNLKYFAKGDIYDHSEALARFVSEKKIRLLKPSYNIKELFKNIDLLLFQSTAPEAFPLVIIEAISLDVSVIALRSKAIDEVLGNYPFIINELRTELIIEKINEYYSDEKLRSDLSKIHRVIVQKYSKIKALNSIDNIYQKTEVKH